MHACTRHCVSQCLIIIYVRNTVCVFMCTEQCNSVCMCFRASTSIPVVLFSVCIGVCVCVCVCVLSNIIIHVHVGACFSIPGV